MSYDFPNRQSIRLRGYDYSQNGLYFVTICVQHMAQILGEIVGADPCVRPMMVLNNVGKMMKYWWDKIPDKFDGVDMNVSQIMPNHLHGIINIYGRKCTGRTNPDGRTHGCAPTSSTPPMLGTIIQWFKTMTTNEYMRHVKTDHWEPFSKRIWQRNYYERIIRNESEYDKICYYIIHNPELWDRDRNNLNNNVH